MAGMTRVLKGGAVARPRDDRLITVLLVVATLFSLLPSGLIWKDYNDAVDLVEGTIEFKLQWTFVFALSGFVVIRHWAFAWRTVRALNPFLLLLLVYCTMTMLWSPEPLVTLKKAIQLGGVIALGVAAQARERSPVYFVKLLLSVLLAIELASAIVVPINPALGTEAIYDGSWRGVLSAKNELGYVAALSLVLWAVWWNFESIRPLVLIPGIALSLLCLVMAKSSTSITMAGLGIFIFLLLRRQHIGSPLWLLRILTAVLLGVMLCVHVFFVFEARLPGLNEVLEPLANIFGKHADLTGRADIWAPLIIEIQRHPVLGLGYGAFWLGVGSASQSVLDALFWIPYQAHNGYLDVLNELGLVGLSLFAGFLLWHVRNLFQLTRADRFLAAFHSTLLVCTVFTNFTESTFFRGVLFPHVLLMLSSVAVTVALQKRKLPQPERAVRLRPTVNANLRKADALPLV